MHILDAALVHAFHATFMPCECMCWTMYSYICFMVYYCKVSIAIHVHALDALFKHVLNAMSEHGLDVILMHI